MKLRDLLKSAEALSKLFAGHITVVPKNYNEDWRGFSFEYRKGSEFEEDPWINIEYWDDYGDESGLIIPEDADMWRLGGQYVEEVCIDLNSEDWTIYPEHIAVIENSLEELQKVFNLVKGGLKDETP